MNFLGIGTATPPARCTQAECLAAFEKSGWYARLDGRAHLIARTVLQRDNGIEARRRRPAWRRAGSTRWS